MKLISTPTNLLGKSGLILPSFMGRATYWSFHSVEVIHITTARTKQMEEQMTSPAIMFPHHCVLDDVPLLSGGVVGRKPVAGFHRCWNTREPVWFSCLDGCLAAKPWKHAVVVQVTVMCC